MSEFATIKIISLIIEGSKSLLDSFAFENVGILASCAGSRTVTSDQTVYNNLSLSFGLVDMISLDKND